MNRTLSWVLAGLALGGLAGCGGDNSNTAGGVTPSDTITGSGSSFVRPMMDKWSAAYEKTKQLHVDYQSIGSGAGVTQMIEKKVTFACSDAYLTKDQLEKAKEANSGEPVHIPLVIGAVAVFYNLPGVDKPLNFDGPLLADIFMGKEVTKWNHPRIRTLNGGVELPDLDIAPVVRADHSGTTFIWTSYLSKVSTEWANTVGVGTLPKWPAAIKNREQKSDGVAGFVAQTKGSIGYVELRHTLGKKDMKYGTVKNKAGKGVLPSLDSTVAAAEAIKENDVPDDLRFTMVDPDRDDAYPICGSVWAVCLTKHSNEDAAALKEFFTWVLHDGQALTKALDYAPLPKMLVERAQKKVDLIAGP